MCPDSSVSDSHLREESFVSLNAECARNHPLPGSYRSRYDGLGTCYEAFVEYCLDVEMSYISRGTKHSVHATRLIIIDHPVPQIQSRCDLIRQYRVGRALQSELLSSNTRESKNALRKKAQGLFGLKNNPKEACIVQVSSPRGIQLNDPAPFQFVITILPEVDRTSTSLKCGPDDIRVNWVSLSLHSQVTFCANSSSGPQASDHYFVQDLQLAKAFRGLNEPIMLSPHSKCQG
jgi:hypothetical protein